MLRQLETLDRVTVGACRDRAIPHHPNLTMVVVPPTDRASETALS
jgi:hypothetical protein